MQPEARRLYAVGTYERTDRLHMLVGQEQVQVGERHKSLIPTMRDVRELWSIYCQECESVGYTPTLLDFADWLGGKGPYEGHPPATIFN